jgi:hypothetical protein
MVCKMYVYALSLTSLVSLSPLAWIVDKCNLNKVLRNDTGGFDIRLRFI